MILISLSLLSMVVISLALGNIVSIIAIAFTVIFGYFIDIYVAVTLLCMIALGVLSYKYKLGAYCKKFSKKGCK